MEEPKLLFYSNEGESNRATITQQ